MATADVSNGFNAKLESDEFKKSLKDAELVLQYANKNYISLNDADYKTYAEHLKRVLTSLVDDMKNIDPLFKAYYLKEHFAGSYADGLKIGRPEEYDMNLIIKLPLTRDQLDLEDATPSFIRIKKRSETHIFSEGSSMSLDYQKWFDKEGYLLQTKIREWMESVLTKTFKKYPPVDDGSQGNASILEVEDGLKYKIRFKKSGPAITLKVTTPDGNPLDVDLVPAFKFSYPFWPSSVKRKPKEKKEWMIIPKPKKLKEGEKPQADDAREWRISFLDQEREIISGSGTVKPTIKLLKKLRDTTNIKISSYAIKTVVLFELEKQKEEFWRNRLTYIFLVMLNSLINRIKEGHIPFYWDERDDLLRLAPAPRENISCRLSKILKEIMRAVGTNPYIIAEKLLSKEEFKGVEENCPVPAGDMMSLSRETSYIANAIGGISPPEQQGNQDMLTKIWEKLEEMQKGQDKICEMLSAIATNNSGKTRKTGAVNSDSESRAFVLEEKILLLQREIKVLQAQKFSPS